MCFGTEIHHLQCLVVQIGNNVSEMTVYMSNDSNIKLVKKKGTKDAVTHCSSTYFINKKMWKRQLVKKTPHKNKKKL